MKKYLKAILIAGLITSNLIAGTATGYITEVSARNDGTVYVGLEIDGSSTLRPYKIDATGDALKSMAATALTAKTASAHVRMSITSTGWVSIAIIAP